MARTRKKTTSIVGSTNEKASTAETLSGASVVTLRVSLRRAYAMDNIPDGNGSTKTVVLPALDDALRGARQGLLTPDGNALFIQMPKADWEAIQALHGKERMFNSWKGNPPCVAEVESVAAAKTGDVADEIAATKTGYAPEDPEKLGVTEVEKTEH